jgi:peptidoglycan biosynthesis protein MviN/MurJ (putative lipid II flippase)
MAATLWRIIFAFDFVLLVLLAISFPSQDPNSAARAITYFSFGIIAVTMISVVALIRIDWDPFD